MKALSSLLVFVEKMAEATRIFANLKSELSTALQASDSRAAATTTSHLQPPAQASNTSSALRQRRNTIMSRLPLLKVNDKEQATQARTKRSIELAFSEFYLSVVLIQNYQTLNFTGFRKILKKHDKVPPPPPALKPARPPARLSARPPVLPLARCIRQISGFLCNFIVFFFTCFSKRNLFIIAISAIGNHSDVVPAAVPGPLVCIECLLMMFVTVLVHVDRINDLTDLAYSCCIRSTC